MVEQHADDGVDEHEQPTGGECGCGAWTDYYGPDPFASTMCDTYAGGPLGCHADCSCWDEEWICDDCYTQSVQDI